MQQMMKGFPLVYYNTSKKPNDMPDDDVQGGSNVPVVCCNSMDTTNVQTDEYAQGRSKVQAACVNPFKVKREFYDTKWCVACQVFH